MMWFYIYSTVSTEAGFKGVFCTAYNKGNMKLYQKRTTQKNAQTVNNDMSNDLRKNMILFVMRQIFWPKFEDKIMKGRTQKNNLTRQFEKFNTSILKKSIPMKTILLRIGRDPKFINAKKRIKARKKAKGTHSSSRRTQCLKNGENLTKKLFSFIDIYGILCTNQNFVTVPK